jgi:hypothetical protein
MAMRSFLCSKAPGLVFSAAHLRGILTPSAFPSTSSGLRFPPHLSHEKTTSSRQSHQKIPHAPPQNVVNLMISVVIGPVFHYSSTPFLQKNIAMIDNRHEPALWADQGHVVWGSGFFTFCLSRSMKNWD